MFTLNHNALTGGAASVREFSDGLVPVTESDLLHRQAVDFVASNVSDPAQTLANVGVVTRGLGFSGTPVAPPVDSGDTWDYNGSPLRIGFGPGVIPRHPFDGITAMGDYARRAPVDGGEGDTGTPNVPPAQPPSSGTGSDTGTTPSNGTGGAGNSSGSGSSRTTSMGFPGSDRQTPNDVFPTNPLQSIGGLMGSATDVPGSGSIAGGLPIVQQTPTTSSGPNVVLVVIAIAAIAAVVYFLHRKSKHGEAAHTSGAAE